MKSNLTDRSTRLRVISFTILIVGLLSSIVIYSRASGGSENPSAYDPEDSKQSLRQMELYGGKANVFAYDVRQWLDGLWHGKSLAFTVGFIAVLLAAGFRLAAIPLPPLEDPEAGAGAGSVSDGEPGGRETRSGGP
jgi:hypothetical protein